jgi:hypothetical protein
MVAASGGVVFIYCIGDGVSKAWRIGISATDAG